MNRVGREVPEQCDLAVGIIKREYTTHIEVIEARGIHNTAWLCRGIWIENGRGDCRGIQ
jgi:hypothetical protein